ncbi:MAG TPA: hypothetical protein VE176_10015, partial [Candidatus Limnocylindrales bacterium]|nr:hypothetical protein [Candidatus Limnocylindrales bacterium]
VIFALFAMARASHLEQPLQRWAQLSSTLPADARWLATRAAFRALQDASYFGFGPGTFRVIFPYYTAGLGPDIEGIWRFLHEDYLQTLLEWGWLGSAPWALLFFGGIAIGIKNLRAQRNRREWRPRYRLFLAVIILALLGTALHALVDFPFQIASLQLYVAVYVGICWGSCRWEGTAVTAKRKKRKIESGNREEEFRPEHRQRAPTW